MLKFNLGSSTLPRPTTKATDTELIRSDKPVTTASTTSLYDNVTSSNQGQGQGMCMCINISECEDMCGLFTLCSEGWQKISIDDNQKSLNPFVISLPFSTIFLSSLNSFLFISWLFPVNKKCCLISLNLQDGAY